MTKSNLEATIDALGILKGQIAELKVQEDALKAALAGLAEGNYEGELFRLGVTMPETRKPSDELNALDKAAVAAFRETLSSQYLTAHNPLVKGYTLTVRARTGKKLAA
jgi:hypothetical protein